jgi:hypothetical protein
VADANGGNDLWSIVQPWVRGLFGPLLFGIGVSIRWLWAARRQHKLDEERIRDEDDAYRLRDRQLLSVEQQAAFARLTAERDRLAAEAQAARAETERAWRTAYAVHRWADEQKHVANNRLMQMSVQWSAGRVAPEIVAPMQDVPSIESFGMSKRDV